MNKAHGLSKDQWPTQDIQELLEQGVLAFLSDELEVIIVKGSCGHYNLAVGTDDETAVLHTETFATLMESAEAYNMDVMHWTPVHDFKVSYMQFVKARAMQSEERDDLLEKLITLSMAQSLSTAIDSMIEAYDKRQEQEKEGA